MQVETPIKRDAAPYSAAETARITADLKRDGYAMAGNVLDAYEVAALKSAMDRLFEDPACVARGNVHGEFICLRLFETDPIFEEMLSREPIISLAESILGADCHLLAQNGLRNAPGQAIDTFHVDDTLIFPAPEGAERHDPRLQMPVFYFNLSIALTDIPSVEYGPAQYVPGSQNSGRRPNDSHSPEFEGRGPVSLLAKAGDMYLFNGQGWHRGAPNTSNQTRYIFGMAFSMRWVSQRMFPFVTYQLPEQVLARADARRRRILGLHEMGAYG